MGLGELILLTSKCTVEQQLWNSIKKNVDEKLGIELYYNGNSHSRKRISVIVKEIIIECRGWMHWTSIGKMR